MLVVRLIQLYCGRRLARGIAFRCLNAVRKHVPQMFDAIVARRMIVY